MPRGIRISDSKSTREWEAQKNRIIDLHVFQNHTLSKVCDILGEQGFNVTQPSIKKRLKRWKVSKNVFKRQSKPLSRIEKRRKTTGKFGGDTFLPPDEAWTESQEVQSEYDTGAQHSLIEVESPNIQRLEGILQQAGPASFSINSSERHLAAQSAPGSIEVESGAESEDRDMHMLSIIETRLEGVRDIHRKTTERIHMCLLRLQLQDCKEVEKAAMQALFSSAREEEYLVAAMDACKVRARQREACKT